MTSRSNAPEQRTIPSYQEIAEQTFGTLWKEARPADWALVVHNLRALLSAPAPRREAVLENALRGLLKQVDDFCATEGEANFYTGEAVKALGGFAGDPVAAAAPSATAPNGNADLVRRLRDSSDQWFCKAADANLLEEAADALERSK